MPWFKVDDSFAGSPKRAACPPAAIGVWVTAGSWCAQQLTDGFVPSHMLAMFGGRSKDAESLVAAGLWEVADGGWQFHDWEKYQPSREQVEADRHAARERQRRAREKAKSQRESQRDAAEVTAVVTVPPTRPDPTRPNKDQELDAPQAAAPRKGTRIQPDWRPSEDAIAWQRGQGISDFLARQELPKFVDYWSAKSGQAAAKLDWDATWRNWLRTAQERSPQAAKAAVRAADPIAFARS